MNLIRLGTINYELLLINVKSELKKSSFWLDKVCYLVFLLKCFFNLRYLVSDQNCSFSRTVVFLFFI